MNTDAVLQQMLESRIRNYIIPGLNSYMLSNGRVRMFESTREYAGTVTPHSHRFDFTCYVLQGEVENRIYRTTEFLQLSIATRMDEDVQQHDLFTVRTLVCNEMGDYERLSADMTGIPFTSETETHGEGDWYSMGCEEFHSISFGRDTRVLFFEGPEINKHNQVLLPFMHGETIETMECDKDWMYLRDD